MTLHNKASTERWPVDGHFTIARGAKHLSLELHDSVYCHGNWDTCQRPRSSNHLQGDVRDLVFGVLLRVDTHQHLYAGDHAGCINPDFGIFGVKPDERDFWVVLAAVIPSGNEAVPQPVNGCLIG